MLLRKLKLQSRESLDERRPALIQALEDIGDFYLELKWDFHSWGRTALCLSDLTVLAFLSCLSIIFKDNFMFFTQKYVFSLTSNTILAPCLEKNQMFVFYDFSAFSITNPAIRFMQNLQKGIKYTV